MKHFKKLFSIAIICTVANLIFISFAISQTPQGFNYQAILHNANGEVITVKQVGLRISILKNNVPVCVEQYTPVTNGFGMVSLALGSVNTVDFGSIDWSTGTFTIKIELDPNGGTSYSDMGTTQLLSVPFALYLAM